MFEFISSYQGEFHYRRTRGESRGRYKLDINNGNRLTVGYETPTPQELAEFQTWQRARLDHDQLTMLANPRRYPRQFWEVLPEPRHLATK